ncbi:MAG: hypothetical protein M1365_12555 [Actinobacteria bacterium]|nr:hypothetical protein [Actinomycetota bacterium]
MTNTEALNEIDKLEEKIKKLNWSIDFHEPKLKWAREELVRAYEEKAKFEKLIINNVKHSAGKKILEKK